MNAFEAAEKNGRAADLRKELEALFSSQNKSPGKDVTSIPATFLRVKPGSAHGDEYLLVVRGIVHPSNPWLKFLFVHFPYFCDHL